MSYGWNIAILGATGAVGKALLKLLNRSVLNDNLLKINKLYPLASEHTAGSNVRFNGKTLLVNDAAEFDWSQVELAFFMAGEAATAQYAEKATESGCIVIDSSSLFALQSDIPLIVPGVNNLLLGEYRNRNIIAVANSLTCQLVTAIAPLLEDHEFSRIHVTNLLSVSAYGKAAVDNLAGQTAQLLGGIPLAPQELAQQVAFNISPLLADAEGSVAEDRALIMQAAKVLQCPQLLISSNSIQVPIFYGHGQAVSLEIKPSLSPEQVRHKLQKIPTIELTDENSCPTPVTHASGTYHLSIGAIQRAYGIPEGLQFWSVADNICFGGAQMAMNTAQHLLQEYLLNA